MNYIIVSFSTNPFAYLFLLPPIIPNKLDKDLQQPYEIQLKYVCCPLFFKRKAHTLFNSLTDGLSMCFVCTHTHKHIIAIHEVEF